MEEAEVAVDTVGADGARGDDGGDVALEPQLCEGRDVDGEQPPDGGAEQPARDRRRLRRHAPLIVEHGSADGDVLSPDELGEQRVVARQPHGGGDGEAGLAQADHGTRATGGTGAGRQPPSEGGKGAELPDEPVAGQRGRPRQVPHALGQLARLRVVDPSAAARPLGPPVVALRRLQPQELDVARSGPWALRHGHARPGRGAARGLDRVEHAGLDGVDEAAQQREVAVHRLGPDGAARGEQDGVALEPDGGEVGEHGHQLGPHGGADDVARELRTRRRHAPEEVELVVDGDAGRVVEEVGLADRQRGERDPGQPDGGNRRRRAPALVGEPEAEAAEPTERAGPPVGRQGKPSSSRPPPRNTPRIAGHSGRCCIPRSAAHPAHSFDIRPHLLTSHPASYGTAPGSDPRRLRVAPWSAPSPGAHNAGYTARAVDIAHGWPYSQRYAAQRSVVQLLARPR